MSANAPDTTQHRGGATYHMVGALTIARAGSTEREIAAQDAIVDDREQQRLGPR